MGGVGGAAVCRLLHRVRDSRVLGGPALAAGRNLQPWSEDFDMPVWITPRSRIVADVAEAPDGSITADRLVERTPDNTHYVRTDYRTPEDDVTYTASYFVKAGERRWAYIVMKAKYGGDRRVFFDLSDGTKGAQDPAVAEARIIPVGNGW